MNYTATNVISQLNKEYAELSGLFDMDAWFNGIDGYSNVRLEYTFYQIKESLNEFMGEYAK